MKIYPRLYKLDIKIIRIFLYYLLELTKMKTKLYPFPQNYNNDDGKPNFKHLYLGFHKQYRNGSVLQGVATPGIRRNLYGLAPQFILKGLKNWLWDQSHICPQITYGIDPKGLLKPPLGLIL